MYTFTPYYTQLVEEEPPGIYFSSFEELLHTPHLITHQTRPGFQSFRLDNKTLLAVYDDKLWVAGYVG